MLNSDGWKERLFLAVKQDGRSERAISLAAGLGENYLNQVRLYNKEPGIEHLLRLGAELRVSLAYLILGREDISPEEEELLEFLRTMTQEQRRVLLEIWGKRSPSRE